jgi:hypothetical protein
MTIKDLKEKFIVEPFPYGTLRKIKKAGKTEDPKEQFILFEKKAATTGRSVHKYLCPITRNGTYFSVKGFKQTRDIQTLESNVKEYINSLPYDSDYYCPRFRDGLTEELIIHDYLGSIGFKNPFYSNSQEYYELIDKNIYGFKSANVALSIWGLDSWAFYDNGKFNLPSEVRVVLHTGDWSWLEVKAKREVEDIKKAIDSVLKPLYLTDSATNVKRATLLKNASNVEMTMNKLMDSYEVGTMDFKSHLKKQLEETLAKLG